MASGLLALLDDVATLLDDVSAQAQKAATKASGVIADDLVVNSQKVVGLPSHREQVVLLWVFLGSLTNKALLIPIFLLLNGSFILTALTIAGAAYLAYEGAESVIAYLFKHKAATGDGHENSTDASIEKQKIWGAIRTDFILSGEILMIAMESLRGIDPDVLTISLVTVGFVMSVFVYGLVLLIVKADDFAYWLQRSRRMTVKQAGTSILRALPYLMKALAVIGTFAMLGVGGELLIHAIEALHLLQLSALDLLPATISNGAMASAAYVSAILLGLVVGSGLIGAQALSQFLFRSSRRT